MTFWQKSGQVEGLGREPAASSSASVSDVARHTSARSLRLDSARGKTLGRKRSKCYRELEKRDLQNTEKASKLPEVPGKSYPIDVSSS